MLRIYTDGACRGNPGPMAIGGSIQDEQGSEVETISQVVGDGTSNIAEYRAVIHGLQRAQALGTSAIELRMDSELVVRQVTGVYKIKVARLKPLHAEVMTLLETFTHYAIVHVPREDNTRADALANLAFDQDSRA